MKKIILILLLAAAVSCKQAATKSSPKAHLDNIEKVFGSGNWQHTVYGDTIYLWFHRESDTLYTVYHYELEDSAANNISIVRIKPVRDSIVMIMNDDGLDRQLVSSNENSNTWNYRGVIFQFKKLDSAHVQLTEDDKITDTLLLTPLTVLDTLKIVNK